MNTLRVAQEQAEKLIEVLRPFSRRIEIAGSVRRRRPAVKDIELVMIPDPDKMFDLRYLIKADPLWRNNKGRIGGKYIQFARTPFSDQLDLFFARPDNWGFVYAVRTGSADFSHKTLGARWVQLGYHGIEGMLYRNGQAVPVREEEDLFRMLQITWVRPEARG